MMRSASAVSSEEDEMSIFPTKILLATDGSREAGLATRTAVDLGQQTNSELHVIHVLDILPTALHYPEATDPWSASPTNLFDHQRVGHCAGDQVCGFQER